MTLPRGYAFEGEGNDVHAVPFTMPEVCFDDPQPVETSAEERIELVRWVCATLDGPRKTAPVRIAALHRVAGFDTLSLRKSAKKAGCSPATLYREECRVKQLLRGKTAKK